MSYLLLVIDMQPGFAAAGFPNTLDNVKLEVQKAINHKAHIFFVEYSLSGPTNPDITTIAKDYDKAFVVTKRTDDGSREVMKAIWQYNAPKRRIKVCGVNTDCCVYETVVGLCWKLCASTIEVLAHACNSDYDHHVGLKDMQREANVIITDPFQGRKVS